MPTPTHTQPSLPTQYSYINVDLYYGVMALIKQIETGTTLPQGYIDYRKTINNSLLISNT